MQAPLIRSEGRAGGASAASSSLSLLSSATEQGIITNVDTLSDAHTENNVSSALLRHSPLFHEHTNEGASHLRDRDQHTEAIRSLLAELGHRPQIPRTEEHVHSTREQASDVSNDPTGSRTRADLVRHRSGSRSRRRSRSPGTRGPAVVASAVVASASSADNDPCALGGLVRPTKRDGQGEAAAAGPERRKKSPLADLRRCYRDFLPKGLLL